MHDKNHSSAFMDRVQKHERQWGTNRYRGRPSLQRIMSAPVVAFWIYNGKEHDVITLHDDLKAIERHFLLQLISNEESNRKLVSVFRNHKQMKIRSVQIEFTEVD